MSDAQSLVSGEAAVSLAFAAYENGKREVMKEPHRLRMQADRDTPFDLIVHGVPTPDRLRRIARLLEACASIMDEAEDSPAPSHSLAGDEGDSRSEQKPENTRDTSR